MIAISYRREDSQAAVGRIHDHLSGVFGQKNVFIDFDSIPYGVDFREHIQKVWVGCDAILVVIGKRWAGNRGDGSRRLDDPNDLLRIEVETALSSRILVIPVLLDGTRMPTPSELPESLHGLTFRNALDLDTGANFKSQIGRLIKSLSKQGVEVPQADTSRKKAIVKTRSIAQAQYPAQPNYGRNIKRSGGLATLQIESDPPGAEVIIDGGEWEEKAPCEIRRVPWGGHHYLATLDDERISSHFEIEDFEVKVMIDFPQVKQHRAEEEMEVSLWAEATKTDSEDGYVLYLGRSNCFIRKSEAEHRLEKLREVRARKEEAERLQREREEATEAEKAKAEAKARTNKQAQEAARLAAEVKLARAEAQKATRADRLAKKLQQQEEARAERMAKEKSKQEAARLAEEANAVRAMAEEKARAERVEKEMREQEAEALRAAAEQAAHEMAEEEARAERLAKERQILEEARQSALLECSNCNIVWHDIVHFIALSGWTNKSLLQRKYHLDYVRASRLLETLERGGIIGPADAMGRQWMLLPSTEGNNTKSSAGDITSFPWVPEQLKARESGRQNLIEAEAAKVRSSATMAEVDERVARLQMKWKQDEEARKSAAAERKRRRAERTKEQMKNTDALDAALSRSSNENSIRAKPEQERSDPPPTLKLIALLNGREVMDATVLCGNSS